jgi:hypothetical protein
MKTLSKFILDLDANCRNILTPLFGCRYRQARWLQVTEDEDKELDGAGAV